MLYKPIIMKRRSKGRPHEKTNQIRSEGVVTVVWFLSRASLEFCSKPGSFPPGGDSVGPGVPRTGPKPYLYVNFRAWISESGLALDSQAPGGLRCWIKEVCTMGAMDVHGAWRPWFRVPQNMNRIELARSYLPRYSTGLRAFDPRPSFLYISAR